MKILITGGAGYIGSRLAIKLSLLGHVVVVVDNLSAGKRSNLPSDLKLYECDIRSPQLEHIFISEKPDTVFHLAASKSVNDSINNPILFEEINVVGSKNVIDTALASGVKKIIFTSTAGIYGDVVGQRLQAESDTPHPSSPYAKTKLDTEKYLQEQVLQTGVQGIILRFANVYGSGGETTYESAINIFVKKALTGETIEVHGDGNQIRDFIYIDDLINACVSVLNFTNSKELVSICNIATGIGATIQEVIDLIGTIVEKKLSVEYQAGVFFGQKTSLLSPENTKKTLNWSSQTTLKEGIVKTINHYAK